MRSSPASIVEELREAARYEAGEMGAEVVDLTSAEAADYIEHLVRALERIRSGEPEPRSIAREALDRWRWQLGG